MKHNFYYCFYVLLLVISTLGDPTVATYITTLQGSENINVTTSNSLVNKLVGSAQDKLGYTAKIIGDCNGDGIDDIAINARLGSPSAAKQYAGIVYIIYGSRNGIGNFNFATNPIVSFTQGFRIFGAVSHDFTGNSISSADINNDGLADILIGSELSNSNAGVVYVIYGQRQRSSNVELSSLLLGSTAGFAIKGIAANDFLGTAVAGIGDMNSDGYEDILFAANGATALDRAAAGVSYVLYGRSSKYSTFTLSSLPTGVTLLTIYGAYAGDKSGSALSAAGDVNGDGYADILIGSPTQGNAYVVYGRSTGGFPGNTVDLLSLPNTIGFRIAGETISDSFGCSVTNLGDFNGDGVADIAIGAKVANDDRQAVAHTGKVYIIYGRQGATSTSPFPDMSMSRLTWQEGLIITGVHNEDYTGASLSVAGDIDGDGKADIVFGAPEYASQSGLAYVIFGFRNRGEYEVVYPLSEMTAVRGFIVSGETNSRGYLGYAVGGGGDVNGDGYDDIIIGAPTSAYLPGTAYVIYGMGYRYPSSTPSGRPSKPPTPYPTRSPTTTAAPSIAPTYTPTRLPSFAPSAMPSFTHFPTALPTYFPTPMPSTAIPSLPPTIYYPTQGPISLVNVIQFHVYLNITHVSPPTTATSSSTLVELDTRSQYILNTALSTLLNIDANYIQLIRIEQSVPRIENAGTGYAWVIPVVQMTLPIRLCGECHGNGTVFYAMMQRTIEGIVISGQLLSMLRSITPTTTTTTTATSSAAVTSSQFTNSSIVSVTFGQYASTIEPPVTSTTTSESSSAQQTFSGGMIAMVVVLGILLIVGCLMAIYAYYYYYHPEKKDKATAVVEGMGNKETTVEEGKYSIGLSLPGATTSLSRKNSDNMDASAGKITYKGIDSSLHVADIMFDNAEVLYVPPAHPAEDQYTFHPDPSSSTTAAHSAVPRNSLLERNHFHAIPLVLEGDGEGEGSSYHDSSYHSGSRHSSPRFGFGSRRGDSQTQSFYGQMTQHDDDGENDHYYWGGTAESRY